MRYCVFTFMLSVAVAMFVIPGVVAQEVPETPEAPELEPAPEAAPADPEPVPEAEPAEEAEPEPEVAEEPEPAAEPEPAGPAGLLFATTMDFELVKSAKLDGKVGEVEIRGIEFGSKSAKGGIFGSKDADLKASINASIECSTTAEKKQKVDFTIEFLDGEGNLIDRAEGNVSLKEESKFASIDHTTLKYVVPLIKKVRISAESKK
ncbi:MAG: hypothetical protein GY906_33370 [bacterium]|nr:hypothetical protein [bacterium]